MFDCKELLGLAKELRRTQRNSYSRENLVFLMTCMNPEAQPREIGQLMQEHCGMELYGDRVIAMYRRSDLGKVQERIRLCRKAWESGTRIAESLHNSRKVDWEGELEQLPNHRERAHLLLLVLTEQAGDLLGKELVGVLRELSRDGAQEIWQLLMESGVSSEEDLEGQNRSLKRQLDYARAELRQLKEQMREEVNEAAAEEREQFFMQLNQEGYGQIFDLLDVTRRGFQKLREQGKQIPMELRSAQTLVRSLSRFLKDYGVMPMAEVGQVLELSVEDMDRYIYEGVPFRSDRQHKRVEIVSSGWEMPERQMVISYPKVRELTEN